MSDCPIRYGMIVLMPLRSSCLRGTRCTSSHRKRLIEFARLHEITRWMVFGDPDGWWPLYTQAGPVNAAPEPKRRVDITLRR